MRDQNSFKTTPTFCNLSKVIIVNRVDGNEDLKFLERGILLEDFYEVRCKRKYDMEFRILQRMTQHKDHVKNLYTSAKMEFKRQNRYNEVLPCKGFCW